jgi:hypothetical protein
MLRSSIRPTSKTLLATVSLVTLGVGLLAYSGIAAAWPVGSADTVTLDDFTSTNKDGDVMTIKHADFEGTNLSKEEIEKIFSGDESEDKSALVQKMKVGKMSIPSIDVAPKKGGAFHVHDILGADIDSGKIGALSISGIDGSGDDKGGKVTIKAGALKVENANFSAALAAATHSGDAAGPSNLGAFSWQNVDLVVPESDGATPDKTIHIAIGSIDLHNNYDGAAFKDGKLTVKGLVVEPSKTADLAASLGILGYTRLDLGLVSAAHYDAGAKTLAVDEITLSGDKMGSFGLKANFGDIGPEIFGTDNDARMGALMGGSISALEIKFANTGLFEKAVGYFADQQKATPEALKKQWSQAAGMMFPALLGGDPAAVKLAGEAQKFIAAPNNLTISVKPKTGSLKFADAMALADPTTAMSKIDITATAGK